MGFLSLIKPLNWAFPTIYSLPENCLEMLSSPLPIICGIQCDYNYAVANLFTQYSNMDNSDLVFVFLDDNYILASKNLISETKMPSFNSSFQDLKLNYGHMFKREAPKTIKADFANRGFLAKKKSFKSGVRGNKDKRAVLDHDEVLIFLHEVRDIITVNLIDILPQTLEDSAEVSLPFEPHQRHL